MTPVIVTRPEPDASAWASQLREAGVDALACPLIVIAPPPDWQALQAARVQLSQRHAVMCVSPQAVRYLLHDTPIPTRTRFWAPGPGTANALQAAGVAVSHIDRPAPEAAQYDSETLWPIVAPQVRPGVRLMWARGQSADGHLGRDWLVQQCQAAGAVVDTCVTYSRQPPVWNARQHAQVAHWLAHRAVWLLSSSEALRHLLALCPNQDWRTARAIVTHPRIQDTAQRAAFGEIIMTRPTLDAVKRAVSTMATP